MEELGCCQRDRARLVEAFDNLLELQEATFRELEGERVKVERLLEGLERAEAQLCFARAALQGRG